MAYYLAAIGRPKDASPFLTPTTDDVIWIYERGIWGLLRQRAIGARTLLVSRGVGNARPRRLERSHGPRVVRRRNSPTRSPSNPRAHESALDVRVGGREADAASIIRPGAQALRFDGRTPSLYNRVPPNKAPVDLFGLIEGFGAGWRPVLPTPRPVHRRDHRPGRGAGLPAPRPRSAACTALDVGFPGGRPILDGDHPVDRRHSLSVSLVSLILKLRRHDPLDRKLDPEPSFWGRHEPNPWDRYRGPAPVLMPDPRPGLELPLPRLRGGAAPRRGDRRRLPGGAPLPQAARFRFSQPGREVRAARSGNRPRAGSTPWVSTTSRS